MTPPLQIGDAALMTEIFRPSQVDVRRPPKRSEAQAKAAHA
jgi:hypothetical protein